MPGRPVVRALGATGAAALAFCAAAWSGTPTVTLGPAVTLTGAEPALAVRTVTVRVEGEGVVLIEPGGIRCSATCAVAVSEGTRISLRAIPADDEGLVRFDEACAETGEDACALTAGADAELAVTFAPPPTETEPPPATTTPPPVDTQPPPPPTPGGGTDLLGKIDEILAGLPLGAIAFNAPERLELGETAVIQLVLSADPDRDVASEVDELGKKESAQIRISNLMEAHLSGIGFRVEAVTPETQAVSGKELTEWRWEIEPTRTGARRLHLTLAAVIAVDGDQRPRTLRTFQRTIEIDVGWGARVTGFLGDNWQWLWGTLLVPLAGWLLRRRSQRAPAAG